MTPDLYHRLDAVLPHVPAGIPALGVDLTDPEERQVAIRWLAGLYDAATVEAPGQPEIGSGAYRPLVRTYEPIRLTASNDLPAPPYWAIPTQPSPPAPGITYRGPLPTGRDDER